MIHSIKPLIATLLLIALVFFCLLTNPTQSDYINWAQYQYKTQQAPSEKGLAEVFLQVVGPTIIEKSTTSTNYILFTLFETKFNGNCMQTIGVLDHFFPLPMVSTSTASANE